MKCVQGYEVEPQRSAAGYFMGTVNEEQIPNCRLTSQYAKTREEALKLPIDREHEKGNLFCNGGCGHCFPNKEYKISNKNTLETNPLFKAANAADVIRKELIMSEVIKESNIALLEQHSLLDHTFEEWLKLLVLFYDGSVLVNNSYAFSSYYNKELDETRQANTIELEINYDCLMFVFDKETGLLVKII